MSENASQPEFIIGTVKNVREHKGQFVYHVVWDAETDRDNFADTLPQEYLAKHDQISSLFLHGEL